MTDPVISQALQRSLDLDGIEDRAAAIGAILHVATEPVSLDTLTRLLGCSGEECRDAIAALESRLLQVGLTLQRTADDQFQVGTAPQFALVLQRYLGLERQVRLSQAALETLAIIAYRQPVTRGDIESVRGVDSSRVVQTLLSRGLIQSVGRQASVGSPMLYGTTPEFLRFFGLTSLRDLPPLSDDLAVALAGSGEMIVDPA